MSQLITLAYSGGLDTSAIVPWLREHHGARVQCCVADVGQGSAELEGVEQKAMRSGAVVLARSSPHSLSHSALATFEADDVYRQGDAAGFLNLFGLPVRLDAQAARRRGHRQIREVA